MFFWPFFFHYLRRYDSGICTCSVYVIVRAISRYNPSNNWKRRFLQRFLNKILYRLIALSYMDYERWKKKMKRWHMQVFWINRKQVRTGRLLDFDNKSARDINASSVTPPGNIRPGIYFFWCQQYFFFSFCFSRSLTGGEKTTSVLQFLSLMLYWDQVKIVLYKG